MHVYNIDHSLRGLSDILPVNLCIVSSVIRETLYIFALPRKRIATPPHQFLVYNLKLVIMTD